MFLYSFPVPIDMIIFCYYMIDAKLNFTIVEMCELTVHTHSSVICHRHLSITNTEKQHRAVVLLCWCSIYSYYLPLSKFSHYLSNYDFNSSIIVIIAIIFIIIFFHQSSANTSVCSANQSILYSRNWFVERMSEWVKWMKTARVIYVYKI